MQGDGDNVFTENLEAIDNSEQGDSLFVKRLVFNEDTLGQILIKAGDSQIEVSFSASYTYPPLVSLTPYGEQFLNFDIKYTVIDVTTDGFIVKLNDSFPEDIRLNWLALASNQGKLFVSDGSVEDINIVIAPATSSSEVVETTSETEATVELESDNEEIVIEPEVLPEEAVEDSSEVEAAGALK